MPDIYENNSRQYEDDITKKTHFQTLPVLEISLDGAAEYTVRSETEYRPDLISLEFYGNAEYDDYITIANKLSDPIKDYVTGKVLFLPTIEAIMDAVDEA